MDNLLFVISAWLRGNVSTHRLTWTALTTRTTRRDTKCPVALVNISAHPFVITYATEGQNSFLEVDLFSTELLLMFLTFRTTLKLSQISLHRYFASWKSSFFRRVSGIKPLWKQVPRITELTRVQIKEQNASKLLVCCAPNALSIRTLVLNTP